MGDIAYQNKDIASKLTGETLVGKNLAVFGLPHLSITGILPTNLPAIESNELRIDNLFQLEDGSLAIMDYESKFVKENFIKYLNYIARVLKRWAGQDRLDEEELMQLMILPLTVKGSRAKQVMIEKTVELACQIPDREQTLKALAGILTFSDKVIDEDYKKRIKEEMRMTQIGQMIFSDGVLAGKEEGKAEGIGIGEDCFAALTEKLIRDSRLNELEMAAKDKALRAALYREYGIKL